MPHIETHDPKAAGAGPPPPSPVGVVLRDWRARRGMSQLDLALAAGTSTRHLSFVETGRSQPSRRMVQRLGQALDLPLRARNRLLAAAGFAHAYPASPLDDAALAEAMAAVAMILAHHEPYPALAMDGVWDIVMANEASRRLMARLGLPPGGDRPLNVLRLMLHPDLLRRAMPAWEAPALALLRRARREVADGAPAGLAEVLDEVTEYPGIAALADPGPLRDAPPPVLPVSFALGDERMSWFTTVTCFGTPQDVALQELRIESFFPMDAATAEAARRLAAG